LENFDLTLADGIFVRAYEDRMDLLRAVIVGAFGTPYQDGLFFFDFHLPSDYPSVPPVWVSNFYYYYRAQPNVESSYDMKIMF